MKFLFILFFGITFLFSDSTVDEESNFLAYEPSAYQQESSPKVKNLLRNAFDMKDTKYGFGASSDILTDCSNFTRETYKNVGFLLPRSAQEQSQLGTKVDKANLQAGDLLFFKTRGVAIGHVGIYIGDGKMIHASYKLRKVVVDSIDKAYYVARFVTAKRLSLE